MDIITKKKNLRIFIKKLLSELQIEEKKNKSISISKNIRSSLLNFFNEHNSKSVKTISIGGFSPLIYEEPIWYDQLLELKDSFKLSFPRYDDKLKSMGFFISSPEDLVADLSFGVKLLSPRPAAAEIMPDILLIPGLAFDSNGNRLGRGKAFYDRYLKDYQGLKVGVCFDCQLDSIAIPLEEHDQKLDAIVTEKRFFATHT